MSASLEHLLAELARLDVLIRVQAWRARTAHGEEADLAGLYVPDAEPDALLDRPLGTPLWATVALPPQVRDAVAAELETRTAAVAEVERAASAAGVELRLCRLASLFDLTRFDVDVVLACLAPELDLRYERLYGYLHDDVTRRRPSVDLVTTLFLPDLPARLAAMDRFDPDAPLLRAHLVELGDEPDHPAGSRLARTLRLDPRVTGHLLGDDAPDVRLRPVATLVAGSGAPGSWEDTGQPDELARLAAHAATGGADLVLACRGNDPAQRRAAAAAFAGRLGRGLLAVDGSRLAGRPPSEIALLAALADREARLHGTLLFWDGVDPLLADEQGPGLSALLDMVAARPGPTVLGGATTWEPSGMLREALAGSRFLRVELATPGAAERERLWRATLAGSAGVGEAGVGEADLDLPAVAGAFRLGAGQIADAGATARNLARLRDPERPRLTAADLRAACRLHSNRRLAELARPITPRAGWDDLVLPADRMEQLREVADQARYRTLVHDTWGFDAKLATGRGLAVLFAGPPGTGKTMAADVLANTLGLELYAIDLSEVVSKYIGETEKNLARIFDEAATSNAVLFFDEADALFGRRSAVRDAHDRYANIEISYLLQRLDEHDGVLVLATNLRKNMDDAFVRRLHATVEFPVPGPADRLRIWQRIWPAATPLHADVDLDALARQVEVPGGNIRNIALAGAFLAAADGGMVTMEHLRRATRREYQKMGKVRPRGATS